MKNDYELQRNILKNQPSVTIPYLPFLVLIFFIIYLFIRIINKLDNKFEKLCLLCFRKNTLNSRDTNDKVEINTISKLSNSTSNNKINTKYFQELLDRKKYLSEISIGLYGVIWGTWWANAVGAAANLRYEVVRLSFGNSIISISTSYITTILSLYGLMFIYFFVRFIWLNSNFDLFSEINPRILTSGLLPLIILTIGLLSAMGFLTSYFSLNYGMYIYGSVISIGGLVLLFLIPHIFNDLQSENK